MMSFPPNQLTSLTTKVRHHHDKVKKVDMNAPPTLWIPVDLFTTVKRRPFKSNTNRTPPPRPPPPSREPSKGSGKTNEEDIPTEEEEEEGEGEHSGVAAGRVMANPKLYQLTSLGQSTGLWWDSFEEGLEELGIGGKVSSMRLGLSVGFQGFGEALVSP